MALAGAGASSALMGAPDQGRARSGRRGEARPPGHGGVWPVWTTAIGGGSGRRRMGEAGRRATAATARSARPRGAGDGAERRRGSDQVANEGLQGATEGDQRRASEAK